MTKQEPEVISAGGTRWEVRPTIVALLSKPDSKMGRSQRNVLALLLDHEDEDGLPTSGRFLFYELEQLGLARKPSPDDKRPNKRRSHGWPPGSVDIGDALTLLREVGVVPWDWIVDESRRVSIWLHSTSVTKYLVDRLREARINPWGDEAPPLLLCESRATAGVLARVAARYCCPVAGTAGQCSGFLRTEIAPLLAGGGRVLYLGDLDRSGNDIEGNTRRVLEEEVESLAWRRLGMTEEQAEERGIEPMWKVDGRDKVGHQAIEVEALGQAAVVELVTTALDDLLPEPLADVLEREREQRASLEPVLKDQGQP